MRKVSKRLLGWLLTLCMVIGMLPATALASNGEKNIPFIAAEEILKEPLAMETPTEPIVGELAGDNTGIDPNTDKGADMLNGIDSSAPANGVLLPHESNPVTVDVSCTAGLMLQAASNTISEGETTVLRDIVLMPDISDSMEGRPFTVMKEAAIKFCQQLMEAEGDNRIALVVWDAGCVSYPFNGDIASVEQSIADIDLGGGTNTAQALSEAKDLMDTSSREGAIKNIVLLTDGLPQHGTSTSNGPYTYEDSRYYGYANSAYNVAEEIMSQYSLYTLGFFHNLTGSRLEFGKRFLYDIQNAGYYEVIDPDDLEFTFGEIAGEITDSKDVLVRRFSFPGQTKTDIEETCYYSDSYFFKDARDYSASLATMSLCLELSSWAREDASYGGSTTAGWTTDVSAVDARFKNARELLLGKTDLTGINPAEQNYYKGLGFENFAVNDFWAARPTKDSIGAVAASKPLTDEDGKQYTLIALAIRGGGYQQEWASNFTVGDTGDHEGFAEARDNVLSFLTSYIQNNQITGPIKLWLVGYSRAGVTANMMAGKLDDNPSLLPNVTLAPQDLFTYTFEAPQGALRANFSNASDYTNIHNIINLNDLVPLVAPSSWGFARYNSDQNLPSEFTLGSRFEEKRDNMLEVYNNIPNTEAYKIQEYVTQNRLNVDWSAWLPGGNPLFSLDEYEVNTAQMLRDSTTFLFDGPIGGRETYYYDFQAGIREILSLLNGGSLSDLLGEGMSPEEFLSRFFEQLTFDRLMEIVSPMFSFNIFENFETRKEKVERNIEDFVADVLNDSDLWGSVTFVAGLGDTLVDLLWRIIESTFADLWENKNTSTLQSVANFIALIAGGNLFQAHYAEVTLAWMMSQDKNYGGDEDQSHSSSYRIVHINCPVDLSVYDGSTLVAQIIDDERTEIPGSHISAYVNTDGEKIVLLPSDTDYTISMQATGEGEVNYFVEEYDLNAASTVRTLRYNAVAVKPNDVLSAEVPALSQQEQEDGIPNGSSATYSLSDGGTPVTCTDKAGTPAEYTVEVTTAATENNAVYGLVSGGGTYTEGSFAQVEAYPIMDSNFGGWYDEAGTLISEETTYRFAVTGNTTLVAHFDEVATYQLTVQAQSGGTVANEYQIYVPAGASVAVEAYPYAGYVFAGWISDSGSFVDSFSTNTQFVMPAQNATVTATFSNTAPSDPTIPNPPHTSDTSSSDTPTTFTITLPERVVGGEISVLPKYYAPKGRLVTITAIPDEGYVLEELTVTDDDDDAITLTDKDNGEYAFTMPASRVKINVVFATIDEEPENPFYDIDATDYYYDAVLWAVENGVTVGTSATTFSPDMSCTRAQMVTFLWRAAGSPKATSGNPFTDVQAGSYYYDAVLWAVEQGITSGTSATTFAPDATVTRGQTVTFLYRANGSPVVSGSGFSDVAADAYYASAVAWAVSENVTVGTSATTFSPDNACTRAQIVTFMYRDAQ